MRQDLNWPVTELFTVNFDTSRNHCPVPNGFADIFLNLKGFTAIYIEKKTYSDLLHYHEHTNLSTNLVFATNRMIRSTYILQYLCQNLNFDLVISIFTSQVHSSTDSSPNSIIQLRKKVNPSFI